MLHSRWACRCVAPVSCPHRGTADTTGVMIAVPRRELWRPSSSGSHQRDVGASRPHSNSHITQMSRFTPWPFSSPLPQLSKSSSGSFTPKGRLSTSWEMRQEPWVAGRLQKGLHSCGALARPRLGLLGEHSSLFTIKLCVQVRRPSAGASTPAQPRLPGPAQAQRPPEHTPANSPSHLLPKLHFQSPLGQLPSIKCTPATLPAAPKQLKAFIACHSQNSLIASMAYCGWVRFIS